MCIEASIAQNIKNSLSHQTSVSPPHLWVRPEKPMQQ
jgi:hypothetical protein